MDTEQGFINRSYCTTTRLEHRTSKQSEDRTRFHYLPRLQILKVWHHGWDESVIVMGWKLLESHSSNGAWFGINIGTIGCPSTYDLPEAEIVLSEITYWIVSQRISLFTTENNMVFHKGFDKIPDFETTSLSIVSQQLRPHPLVATHQGLTTAAQGRQHDLGTRHWDDPRHQVHWSTIKAWTEKSNALRCFKMV